MLGFTDVDFAYPGGPTLFRNLNFGVGLESRFAIVGPNGIGKSTLLGLISGALQPVRGSVFRNGKLRMGVFSQHHVDSLDLALTPLQYLAKCFPDVRRAGLGCPGEGCGAAARAGAGSEAVARCQSAHAPA